MKKIIERKQQVKKYIKNEGKTNLKKKKKHKTNSIVIINKRNEVNR